MEGCVPRSRVWILMLVRGWRVPCHIGSNDSVRGMISDSASSLTSVWTSLLGTMDGSSISFDISWRNIWTTFFSLERIAMATHSSDPQFLAQMVQRQQQHHQL